MSHPLALQGIKHSTILAGILLFAFFVRVPTMFVAHGENDEIIYITLINKVIKHPLDYSLQGTYVLSQLTPEVYDYPVFRHPPLFVAVLAIICVLLGQYVSIFMPAVFGVLTIAVVYLITTHLYSKTQGLMAALILACCPLWLFLSTRVWIETMVTFLTILSFYLVMLSCNKKQLRWFFYAGVVFGLALLTKQVALFILPSILYLIVRQDVSWGRRSYSFLIFISVAILINVPWLMYYYQKMGTVSYVSQYQHTNIMLQMFPVIQVTVNRPWYYYFMTLPSIYPMYFLSFVGIFLAVKRRENVSLVIWSATVLLVYTLLGMGFDHIKLSYTMRFIALALPALAIFASCVCNEILSRSKWINIKCMVLMVFLSYGIGIGILNFLNRGSIDILGPAEVLQSIGI